MAKELAEVASHYQAKPPVNLQLNMHTSSDGEWDEIYIISEDVTTGKKWQVVKVALAKLSEEERKQLVLQVEMYNQSTATCMA